MCVPTRQPARLSLMPMPGDPAILTPMRNTAKYLLAGAFTLVLATGVIVTSRVLWAQAPQAPGAPVVPPVPQSLQTPTFRLNTDLVSLDVIVRDPKGQFVADLKPQDFELYEDGVKQEHRLLRAEPWRPDLQPEGAAVDRRAGRRLRARQPADERRLGRVFLLFIDDLHLDFGVTPKTRELLKKMLKYAHSRWRHVRHRHDRDVVGVAAAHLRQADPRVGDHAHHRQRAEAVRDPESRVVGSAGTDRGASSRARGVRNAHTNW